MIKRTTREMSDAHEDFLAILIDGRRTPGSGNQFNNQMDVRNDARRQHHAFAADGKATLSRSMSVTCAMLTKAREQAHNEAPMIALRWYADETLRKTDDWIMIEAEHFAMLLHDAREYRRLLDKVGS